MTKSLETKTKSFIGQGLECVIRSTHLIWSEDEGKLWQAGVFW
jgi:hypothetical protein